jgi:phosphinothricin acetyltransferase
MDPNTPAAAPRTEVTVREMVPGDWPEVRDIYEQGIATGDATFETRAPTRLAWDAAHLASPRLVACVGAGVGVGVGEGRLLGWAALTPVSPRAVYRGVADLGIYVADGARHRGVGRALLEAMIERSETQGIWTLQAGVFPENRASLALHVGGGFRIVGTRDRMGRMGDRWRDVVLLERRSPTVG